MTPSLYELSEAIRAEEERISDIMERTQGEEALMTPEDREAVSAFIDGLRTEANLKADGYARVVRNAEARAEMRRAEAKRLADMAAADERRAESIKRFVLFCMERAGMKRLEGQTFTLAAQANGGKQPVEVFAEADRLPERFVRIKREADRDALRDAIIAGDAEAAQYAELRPRGVTLRIR